MENITNSTQKTDQVNFVKGAKGINTGARFYLVWTIIAMSFFVLAELAALLEAPQMLEMFSFIGTWGGSLVVVLFSYFLLITGYVVTMMGVQKLSGSIYDIQVLKMVKGVRIPLIIAGVSGGILALLILTLYSGNYFFLMSMVGLLQLLFWLFYLSIFAMLIVMGLVAQNLGKFLRNEAMEHKGNTFKKISIVMTVLFFVLFIMGQTMAQRMVFGGGMGYIYTLLVVAIIVELFFVFVIAKYAQLFRFISENPQPISGSSATESEDLGTNTPVV